MQKGKIAKNFLIDVNLNIIDGQEDNSVSEFRYIQDNLLLYYDAKNNVGDSHSTETQEWKNLANNSNNGILNGNPTWNDDSLYFDGIDDSSADYIKFHLNNYSSQRINSTKTLNDGKAHNIIATYKNDKLILYIDGELDGSVYVPKGLTYSNLNINIGRWIVGQQYYKGNIYSVKVYNKYLIKDEVLEDYQYEKK